MASKKRRPGAATVVRERLRLLRQQRGLTQEALAEKAGVSVDAVTRIESGRRSPRLDTLERLAAALAVNLQELVAAKSLPDQSQGDEHLVRIQAMLRGRTEASLAIAEAVLRAMMPVLR
jgi:transcriptional regulator with XRE-family HTH domain